MEFDPPTPGHNTGDAAQVRREQDIAILEALMLETSDSSLWVSGGGAWETYRSGRKLALREVLKQELIATADQVVWIFDSTKDAAETAAGKITVAMDAGVAPEGGWRIGRELELELQSPYYVNLEQAVRMITLFGLYDLHKRGNIDQLTVAVDLLTGAIKFRPGFDPAAAGYDNARGDIVAAIAAIRIDNRGGYGKSNVAQRNVLLDRLYNQLDRLEAGVAHTDFSEDEA